MSVVDGSRTNRKAKPAKRNDTAATTRATRPAKRNPGSVPAATSEGIATIVVRAPNTRANTPATRDLRDVLLVVADRFTP
ncbi:hypothetical protein AB1285_12835 [Microbacterium sp. NRRL B-14842]|uniref:hypothetical protein n=1 Tax=Microbacterium sp. NRRL B-14842 TaxID=3162881 RepID=UPI003D26DF20